MSSHSPIPSPPWELVQQWSDIKPMEDAVVQNWVKIATEAALWGADRELEACCEWFICDWTDIETADRLRAARRPKPPSLKEQALSLVPESGGISMRRSYSPNELLTIRRALEALPND